MEFRKDNSPEWLQRIDRSQTGLQHNTRVQKSLLALGFAFATVAIYLAHVNPADSYEVSLYAGTPLVAWVAAAVAMAIAILVVIAAGSRRTLGVALALAGTVVTWAIAIPILRGYTFYGYNDSLTHLGWVQGLTDATLSPYDIVYPAAHLSSSSLSIASDGSTMLAMQLVVLAFALAYVVFVPMLAYRLVPDLRIAAVATFGALLFVPVNLGGFKLMFFPFSMASFLVPMLLYLLVRHATTGPSDSRPTGIFSLRGQFLTRSAGLFVLASFGMIVLHPQAAFDLLVLLVGLLVAKALFTTRWRAVDDPDIRPVSGLTTIFAGLFLVWAVQFEAFFGFAGKLSESMLGVLTGQSGLFGMISQRSESASSVGASLVEVFWKLFLVDAAFLAVAFGLTWVIAARRLDLPGRSILRRAPLPDHGGETLAASLGVGMLLFVPYAGIYLLGSISDANFFFRHFGFLLIPGTVLGSIGLVTFGTMLGNRYSSARVKQTGAILATVVLVLSMVTLFPSPFVYLPSQHVTAQEISGFDTAFDHAGETPLVTVRGSSHRHAERLRITDDLAYGGRLTPDRLASADSPVGPTEMVYFGVSKRVVDSEVEAFRELRYSQSYFDAIPSEVGVNRVAANSGFDLYYTQSRVVAKNTSN